MIKTIFRKTISLMIACCLLFSFTVIFAENNYVLSDVSREYIRVGLLYGKTAVDFVKLECPKGFLKADMSQNGWGVINTITDYSELYVFHNYEENTVDVMSKDGQFRTVLNNNQGIMPIGSSLDSMIISINDKNYRDGVMFSVDDDGHINVINYVSIEHYLWGVLRNEAGYNCPEEALKALAITARSFAYKNSGKHENAYGFDVCPTSDCQVYGGYTTELDSCSKACKDTEGLVMTYEGEPVTGYYSANSGGYTLNSEDVWTGVVPYARAIKDEYSPESNWQSDFSFADVKTRLINNGIDIGDVIDVKIQDRNEFGSVISLRIKGTEGETTVSKSKMKNVFSLKSQNFEIKSNKSGEAEYHNTAGDYVYVIDGSGNTVQCLTSSLCISDGKNIISSSVIDWSSVSLGEAFANAEPADMLSFIGHGSGHGVGMAMQGAMAMAKQGKSCEEILKYYYTGIEIEKYGR